jgi:hypothetical protein
MTCNTVLSQFVPMEQDDTQEHFDHCLPVKMITSVVGDEFWQTLCFCGDCFRLMVQVF